MGSGSIKITAIDDFDTDVTGKYPSLVILNADIPRALSPNRWGDFFERYEHQQSLSFKS